jgi:hypothetical protein
MITENSIMTSLPARRDRRLRGPFYTDAPGAFKVRAGSAARLRAAVAAGVLAVALATPCAAGDRTAALAPDPLQFVAPSRPFRTLHTALDLDVDVEHQRIAGSVTHTLQSLRPGVEEIRFNCVELSVDSVTVDGRRAAFDYPVSAGQNTGCRGRLRAAKRRT